MPTDLIHLIGIAAPADTIYRAIITGSDIRWQDGAAAPPNGQSRSGRRQSTVLYRINLNCRL